MIGVGIIGAGHFGRVHAKAISLVDGLVVVAACREGGAQDFVSEHGGTPYSEWQHIVADPRVQIVVVATPHQLHEEIAVAAARAGKHILLEKPMAPTFQACEAISQAASKAGVHLLVGHTMHFALPCLRAKVILDTGILGRAMVGTSSMVKLWMEANRKPWHLSPEMGGGMLMTAGIHALDRLVFLMGQEVVGVSATMASLLHAQNVDDTALITLRFADGALGQVQSIGHRGGPMTAATDIICEKGVLRLDLDQGVWIGQNGSWEIVPDSAEPDWMLRAVEREWRALLDALQGNVPLPISPEFAAHIVQIIEASCRANIDRREVSLFNQGEEQIGQRKSAGEAMIS